MMKVLFVATVRSHIGQFHMPFITALKQRGCVVHAAFKDNSDEKPGLDLSDIDKVFEVPFSRSPYSADNIKAYKILKKIIDIVNTFLTIRNFLNQINNSISINFTKIKISHCFISRKNNI